MEEFCYAFVVIRQPIMIPRPCFIEKTFLDSPVLLFTIEEVDEVQVLNVGDPIGESTRREIEDARMLGKTLRWLEPEVHVMRERR